MRLKCSRNSGETLSRTNLEKTLLIEGVIDTSDTSDSVKTESMCDPRLLCVKLCRTFSHAFV